MSFAKRGISYDPDSKSVTWHTPFWHDDPDEASEFNKTMRELQYPPDSHGNEFMRRTSSEDGSGIDPAIGHVFVWGGVLTAGVSQEQADDIIGMIRGVFEDDGEFVKEPKWRYDDGIWMQSDWKKGIHVEVMKVNEGVRECVGGAQIYKMHCENDVCATRTRCLIATRWETHTDPDVLAEVINWNDGSGCGYIKFFRLGEDGKLPWRWIASLHEKDDGTIESRCNPDYELDVHDPESDDDA